MKIFFAGATSRGYQWALLWGTQGNPESLALQSFIDLPRTPYLLGPQEHRLGHPTDPFFGAPEEADAQAVPSGG